jgi:hypothetical protein
MISLRNGAVLHTLEGPAHAAFGSSVDGGCDVDGDGVPDVLVGAPRDHLKPLEESGGVAVFSGATGKELWSELGSTSYGRLGTSVAFLPDINRDGFPDWAASAPADRSPWLGLGAGHVQFYAGPGGDLLRVVGGTAARFGGYGRCVTATGDADGDGVSELVVTADYSAEDGMSSYVELLSPGTGFGLLRRLPQSGLGRTIATGVGPDPHAITVGSADPPGFTRISLAPAPR